MLQQHFFTAWHSSSQQGREIRHCIPLKKQWWCRFEECDLPRLELGDHLHNKLYSFNLHPCLTALLSPYLVPLCYGGRRLISRDCIALAGQLQKQLGAKCLTASSCCLHMGIAATALPGWVYLVTFQPWEILRQTYFQVYILQKIWCSVSNLAL